MQPSNGIKIKDCLGNNRMDCELFDLIPFLKNIAQSQCPDVRKELPSYIGSKAIRRGKSMYSNPR